MEQQLFMQITVAHVLWTRRILVFSRVRLFFSFVSFFQKGFILILVLFKYFLFVSVFFYRVVLFLWMVMMVMVMVVGFFYPFVLYCCFLLRLILVCFIFQCCWNNGFPFCCFLILFFLGRTKAITAAFAASAMDYDIDSQELLLLFRPALFLLKKNFFCHRTFSKMT